MAIGPGKYDELCSLVREKSGALTAIVIIENGIKGSGFSVQTIDATLAARLPEILRAIAKQIEESI